jgi:dolichol kinase
MMNVAYCVLIIALVLVGLYMANVAYDKGVPHWESRKWSHISGGYAYLLLGLLTDSAIYGIVVSSGFGVLLVGARWLRPAFFRGTGGSGRGHAYAECWFPFAGTLCFVVGWLWLGNPWLAIVPCLFLAWGDAVTGLVRSRYLKAEAKGDWGSVACLVTCLLVAMLFQPYWIGALGAVVATGAEKFTPLSKGFWDDNWTIPIVSLIFMALLWEFA